jgi:hypothetical protein
MPAQSAAVTRPGSTADDTSPGMASYEKGPDTQERVEDDVSTETSHEAISLPDPPNIGD